jgi:RNA polymerase sigma-70 factor (ECF subfamily)
MTETAVEELLISQIRRGDEAAWRDLIARYEGRLLGYVEQRLRHRTASEDIVQETFVGFLLSLPNFDGDRPLESYLFTIAAHKLTDHLRRSGRRPTIPLQAGNESSGEIPLAGKYRGASTLARSGERRALESAALAAALRTCADKWRSKGEWDKLRCAELLLVAGQPNKQVAATLGWSEQSVANLKFDLLERLTRELMRQKLNPEVFPELESRS